MTIRFRKRLLVALVILFSIGAMGVVYYSQGYRIDIATRSITRTGAIHIQSTPKDVSITLNDKSYKDKSSLLRRGTFISNVLPRQYRLTITKDGYHPYTKNIAVAAAEVTRLLNILLIPTTLDVVPFMEGVKGDSLVSYQHNQFLTADTESGTYYTCPTAPLALCTNLSSVLSTLLKQTVSLLLFHPQESGVYIAQTSSGIYRVNLTAKETIRLHEGPAQSLTIDGSDLVVVAPYIPTDSPSSSPALSSVFVYDLTLSSLATSYQLPLAYSVIDSVVPGHNNIAIMLTNGSLILYDPTDRSLNAIAHSARMVTFSPDQKKLLFQDKDGKTFVYMIDDETLALDMQSGESFRLLLADAARIRDIAWVDNYHLLLTYSDKLVVAEVDWREPNNQFAISSVNSPILFDSSHSIVYFLSDDGIVSALRVPTF